MVNCVKGFSGLRGVKQLEVFLLPLDVMLVWLPPALHLLLPIYTYMDTLEERGTLRIKCLAQEHNAMNRARGLEPGMIDLESKALIIRPSYLPPQKLLTYANLISCWPETVLSVVTLLHILCIFK